MTSNVPSGTVTFLFTDIENSTQLWEKHPQEMLTAQARHNEILQQAIESNNGYVFQVEMCYAAEKLGLHPEQVSGRAHPANWADKSGHVLIDNIGPKTDLLRRIGLQ